MRKLGLATTAAVLASPLMALPAMAGTCPTASISTYTSSFSCTVGTLTFSNFSFGFTGNVTGGEISPTTAIPGEFGLILSYSAAANPTQTTADVSWDFDVSGTGISDALAILNANVTPPGTATLGEQFYNSSDQLVGTINLSAPSNLSGSVTFTPPVNALFVDKDQQDLANLTGTATSSSITDVFSLTQTPIPGSLPLFGSGLAGVWMWSRKKRKAKAKAIGPVAA
jgi:hypothetical protein